MDACYYTVILRTRVVYKLMQFKGKTKIFIISFEIDSKIIHIEVYYKIFISVLIWEILPPKKSNFPPSWIDF